MAPLCKRRTEVWWHRCAASLRKLEDRGATHRAVEREEAGEQREERHPERPHIDRAHVERAGLHKRVTAEAHTGGDAHIRQAQTAVGRV